MTHATLSLPDSCEFQRASGGLSAERSPGPGPGSRLPAVLEKELKLSRQLRAYIVQLAADDGLFEHRYDGRGVISGHVGVHAFPFADAPEELFEREFLGILARPVEWLLELLGKLGGEIPFLGY
jgi:hypothetical protein